MKNEKQAKWLTDRVQTIRGLKSPNEPQRLLVILHDKADKTAQEIKTLSLLIQAERAAEKAQEARTGNDSNLLIVFYVQIMPDDFVMQLHRF